MKQRSCRVAMSSDFRAAGLERAGLAAMRAQKFGYAMETPASTKSSPGAKRKRAEMPTRNAYKVGLSWMSQTPSAEDVAGAPLEMLDCLYASQQGLLPIAAVHDATAALACLMAAGLGGEARRNRLRVDPGEDSRRVPINMRLTSLALVRVLEYGMK